jgi:hypothetical protein
MEAIMRADEARHHAERAARGTELLQQKRDAKQT